MPNPFESPASTSPQEKRQASPDREQELSEHQRSRFVSEKLQRYGYKEYGIPQGMTLQERVVELSQEGRIGDVVVSRDGKIMVVECLEKETGTLWGDPKKEGSAVLAEVRPLSLEDPEDIEEIREAGKRYKIRGDAKARREAIKNEMATGQLEKVSFISGKPEYVIFKYKEGN